MLLWAFTGGDVGTLVARGKGTDVREDDDRSAVVIGGGMGEMGLAQARSGGEMDTGTKDRGG